MFAIRLILRSSFFFAAIVRIFSLKIYQRILSKDFVKKL
nr:MAG TPA: hypothetical protein [Caudoviricetes sp.]